MTGNNLESKEEVDQKLEIEIHSSDERGLVSAVRAMHAAGIKAIPVLDNPNTLSNSRRMAILSTEDSRLTMEVLLENVPSTIEEYRKYGIELQLESAESDMDITERINTENQKLRKELRQATINKLRRKRQRKKEVPLSE